MHLAKSWFCNQRPQGGVLLPRSEAGDRGITVDDRGRTANRFTWHEDKFMVQARWNGATIADSDSTIVIEGNHYFPPEAVDRNFLEGTTETSFCPWKGTARYFTISVNGALNPNAAWTYPDPKPQAEPIRDYVAFWRGVDVG